MVDLDVDVRNNGENAFEASVTIELPAGVQYTQVTTMEEVSLLCYTAK